MAALDWRRVSDEDLYQMCLRGEEEAWGYVYHYLLSIVRWPRWQLYDAPEDMAQTVVESLIAGKIGKVRTPQAFRAFLRQVAINAIKDHFKKMSHPIRRTQPLATDDPDRRPIDPPDSDPDPEARSMSKDLLQLVDRLLDELPRYCRRTLTHYFAKIMGFIKDYQELADILDQSVSTTSVQVKRCLDLLGPLVKKGI